MRIQAIAQSMQIGIILAIKIFNDILYVHIFYFCNFIITAEVSVKIHMLKDIHYGATYI